MNHFRGLTLFLLMWLAGSQSLYSQSYPDFVFSGGMGIIGKGVFQTDFGVSFARNELDTSGLANQLAPYITLKYGLSDKSFIGLNYSFSQTNQFISDIVEKSNAVPSYTLSFTHQILKNWSVRTNLSLASNDISTANTSWQTQLIAEHSFAEFFTWQNNLGVAWNFNSTQPTFNYLSGIVLGLPKPLDIILEVYGNANNRQSSYFTNLGLGIYFSKNFMSEIYAGFGQQNGNNQIFGSVNLFYRIVPVN